MRPLGDLLAGAARRLGAGAAERRARLGRAWQRAVGAQLARQAEPLDLDGTTLVLRTAGSIWSQEILLRQTEILERLSRELRSVPLEKIRCRVGPVESAAPRPRRARTPEPPLGREEAAGVERLAGAVDDPGLGRSLRRLIELSTRRRTARLAAGEVTCPLCGRIRPESPCATCRHELADDRRKRILREIARRPWIVEEELRQSFPGLSRAEHMRLRNRLRSRLLRDLWSEVRTLRPGDPLAPALRSRMVDLAMVASGLPPGDLDERHLRHALGPTLARAYLEDRAPDLEALAAQRPPKKRDAEDSPPSSSERGFQRTGVPGFGAGRRPR